MAGRVRSARDELKPSTIQIGGWIMLAIFMVFYLFTGQQSSLFVGVAASFILLGRGRDAADAIAKKYGYSKDEKEPDHEA